MSVVFMFVVGVLMLGPGLADAQVVPIVVPAEPAVSPVIPSLSEIDTNNNKIDDALDAPIISAESVLANPSSTAQQLADAQAILGGLVTVEFCFSRQITLFEMNAFIGGGQSEFWSVRRCDGPINAGQSEHCSS